MIGRSNVRALLEAEGLPLPVDYRPIRRARNFRLRLDDSGRFLKLTAPARVSRAKALAWALGQSDWVEEQLARLLPAEPFLPGALIPILGVETRLAWVESAPRTPHLERLENESRLIAGGSRDGYERRIERWLRQLARDTLSAESSAMAATIAARITAVGIGDAGSRWGSCSSAGRIRYSWRLVLAPPEVRRLVVAHEVAHLRHLDHGREFKALERQLFGPGTAAARAELKRCGPRLRRFGRAD